MKVSRGFTPSEILNTQYDVFDFDNDFFDAFGNPERYGVWFIWGNSANGKTSFALKLAKYLARFERVAYNSLEEGRSKTIRDSFERVGMEEVEGRFILIQDDIAQLRTRLKRQRSPKVVFIDSLEYTGLTFKRFLNFVREFPKHLFVFIAHARGSQPRSKLGESVMYHADLKIWVEGYKAHSKGRYIGDVGEFVIWEEGARRYWGN